METAINHEAGRTGPGSSWVMPRAFTLSLIVLMVLSALSMSIAGQDEGAPGAPTDLTAVEEAGLVVLSWEAPENVGNSSITQYNILRGDSDLNLEFLHSIGGTTFTDNGVERNKTYFYAVTAQNSNGTGPVSNIVSVEVPALTVPTTPRTLTATVADGVVTITWGTPVSNGGSNITGYVVLRALDPTAFTQLTKVGLVLEFQDKNVEPGKTYFYQVRAENVVGVGPGTNQAEIEVPEEAAEGIGGLPWWVVITIFAIVAVIFIIMLLRAGGKKGGPEAMAPMGKEPEPETVAPHVMAEQAAKDAEGMPPPDRTTP